MSCGGRGRGWHHGHHDHSPQRQHRSGFQQDVSLEWTKTFTTTFTIPSEVSNPTLQPSIPFVRPIDGGINPGMRLHVEGVVPPNAKQFQINFKTGAKDSDDVAFHFNPRIGQCLYMNIYKDGKWQKEELSSDKPFVKGAPFKLLFVINNDFYEVHINGAHFYTFNHRIPLTSVNTLQITGDVSVSWMGFEEWNKTFTATFTIPSEVSNPTLQPSIPFVRPIDGGIKPGMRLHVEGVVPPNAKQFQINFKTGAKYSDDVAFHFNPRIGQCLYMNIYKDGKWQKEELGSDKPFVKGAPFKLLFVINKDFYEVHINGAHFYTFNHRIPLTSVNTLQITGDVSVSWMGFEKWKGESISKEKKFIMMGCGSWKFIPLEISSPISQPAIPYVGQIPGGMRPDTAIVFQGNLPADANEFTINFRTGKSAGDDTALHYRVYIGKSTVLNSFRNGQWETPENASAGNYIKGGAFIILVVLDSNGYEIYVNGSRHCTFKHRIPLEKVSTVEVLGNISLLLYGFIYNWSSTSSSAELKTITSTEITTSTSWPLEISYPVSNPTLPYVGKIPGGLKQDMAIFLQGTVREDAKSIGVNFKTGTSDDDDIAFHYNPRIGSDTELNSFRNGGWETSETVTGQPFTKGGAFQIFISVKSDNYEVYVNGIKHCTFKHRIPFEKVSAVRLTGDVSLLLCGFIKKWTCPFSLPKEHKVLLMGSGPSTFIPLHVSQPVSNPAIPYVSQIPGGIKPDTAIVFQGSLPEDANEFTINFRTGKTASDDTAFHYKIFIGKSAILNSFRNGKWETKENISAGNYLRGGVFIILVVLNSNGYEVYVNGLRHCTFKHRTPLEKVSRVEVHGDLSLLLYGFIYNWSTTSSSTEIKKITSIEITPSTSWPLEISYPVSNPTLPYVGKIPGGLQKDMGIFLQGTVREDAKSIGVNFKTGTSDDDDIAFHYNPRIGSDTELNSFRNGGWETSETVTGQPFTKGGAFQIFISVKSDNYEVYVNGIKHCTFKHRIPFEKVSAVRLTGDVSLLLYGFIQKWLRPFLLPKEHKILLMGSGRSTFIPLQVSQPISNPAIPYVSQIPGGIKPDTAIVFQGNLSADAKEFTINFRTGKSAGDDTALHYRVYIGKSTVLNSFRNGQWETPENASAGNYIKGGAFIILVVLDSNGYEIYVNGSRHCTFKHRIPLEKVSTVEVLGNLSLLLYGFIYNWSSTSSSAELKKTTSTEITTSTSWPLEISYPVSNPTLPYVGKIPGGLKQDMAIFLQGTVREDAKSIGVNFKTGTSDDDDIAFHYNPRIGSDTELNSFRNGGWETSETVTGQPFTKGGAFQIFISVKSDNYEVYVNGIKHCTFKHRIPFEKVSAVRLTGDVSLLLYGFIQKWTCPFLLPKEHKILLMGSGPSTFIPLQVSQPISNPAIPCVSQIPGGIKPDTAIVFQGNLPADAKEFTINFRTGKSAGDDTALHYRVYIGKSTVLNSFRNEQWETPENASAGNYIKGGAFIILVVLNSNGYEIYVNGLRHCTFKHRIPLEKVSTVEVLGNLSLLLYGFIYNWSSTSSSAELKKTTITEITTSTSWPLEISYPVSNPTLPYVGKIPGGLKQDMAIFLQGTVREDAKSIGVNFKTGTSDDDDIAFHYNPRIGSDTELNSFRNGGWETSETVTGQPFTKGGAFQIFISVKSDNYEVYVNGIKHCTFKHRIPFEKVSAVRLTGDVSLLLYGFIQKWTCPFLLPKEHKILLMGSGPSTFIPLQVSQPISNPAIPCVSQIPGGIKPDTAIVFQGNLPADAKEFTINFRTGKSAGDDTALHYRVYIGKSTVLNSFRNEQWETPENASAGNYIKGGAFIILVVLNSNGYEIYVNGLRHCTFKHRIPLEKVSTVEVLGNLSLLLYGFIYNWSSTSSSAELKKTTITEITTSTSWPLEISYPVSNPTLPYVGKIPGGLKQDMAIFLQGTVREDAKSIGVNFKTGTSDDDDIAFHYNPRIGSDTELNSFRNGGWETSETVTGQPFTKGGAFQIFISVKSDNYEVYVNGIKHCTFKHRIPFEKVSAVRLTGDVSLLLYGFIQKWTCPFLLPKEHKVLLMGSGPSTFIPLQVSQTVSNPAIPYVSQITGGIKPDTAIVFQGNLPADTDEFTINFRTGKSAGDDTALHYRVYIGKSTVLNSFRNGQWETPENESAGNYIKGGAFVILIVLNSNGYEIYVNGLRHCTFKHRIPLEKVSTVEVLGKISLLLYGFIYNWSTTSSFKELKNVTSSPSSTSTLTSFPFEIRHPVINPVLPYVGDIPKGIHQDRAIFFHGTVPANANEFEINFKTGPSVNDDTAFHYNPRIGQHTAMNSFRNGAWETEERAPDKPFARGETFQIIVVIRSDAYEVYVNGSKHCTFKHRIPPEKVSTLGISGAFPQLLCGFIDNWSTSLFFKSLQQIKVTEISSTSSQSLPLEISHPVSNPVLPYVGKIPGGIKKDMAIFFQGSIPKNANAFEINFKTGPSANDDTAFHYNPRIGQHTALNSFRNGAWETQETVPDKPFGRGEPFQIIIVIKSDAYEVYVNGPKHCTFKHRIPPENVSTLGISGDVSQIMCGFIDSWSSSSFFKEINITEISSTSSGSLPVEISHPISNPVLPYVGKIPGGIKKDLAVFLQVSIPPNATGFEINFKTGPSVNDDTAFHYNPRIGQHTALNSFRNGAWETEERAPDKPFARGETFQIIVVIMSEAYEVFVNGLKHCVFNHRIPLEKVSTLGLCGDIVISICGFIENWSTSSILTEIMKTQSTQSVTTMTLQISQPISNPVIPYVGKIPVTVKQHMAAVFQGTVLHDGKSFEINFKTGPSKTDDIAFHYNPRLGQFTTLNSFINGKWETQENIPANPFTKGEPFQMIVVFNSESYDVFVNGRSHCTYKHLIPIKNVSTIAIAGDLTIQLIGFAENVG